jgi:hypothetical protein
MARSTLSPVVASGTLATASGSSAAFKLSDSDEYVAVLVSATAVSGTSPSSTFTVEWSNDGLVFAQGDPADTFTAITAVSNKAKDFAVKGAYMRLVWTITGTSPSFTFGATAVTRGSRAFE